MSAGNQEVPEEVVEILFDPERDGVEAVERANEIKKRSKNNRTAAPKQEHASSDGASGEKKKKRSDRSERKDRKERKDKQKGDPAADAKEPTEEVENAASKKKIAKKPKSDSTSSNSKVDTHESKHAKRKDKEPKEPKDGKSKSHKKQIVLNGVVFEEVDADENAKKTKKSKTKVIDDSEVPKDKKEKSKKDKKSERDKNSKNSKKDKKDKKDKQVSPSSSGSPEKAAIVPKSKKDKSHSPAEKKEPKQSKKIAPKQDDIDPNPTGGKHGRPSKPRGKKASEKETKDESRSLKNDKRHNDKPNKIMKNENKTPRQDSVESSDRKPRSNIFEEHLTYEEYEPKLKSGELFKGTIRINAKMLSCGFVTLEEGGIDYFIPSKSFRNRSLDGDTVILQPLVGDAYTKAKAMDQERKTQFRSKFSGRDEAAVAYINNYEKGDGIDEDDEYESDVNEDDDDESNKPMENPYGKIVAIDKRNGDGMVAGTIEFIGGNHGVDSSRSAIFTPINKKMPFVYIPAHTIPKKFLEDPMSMSKMLYKCKITQWKTNQRDPRGVVVDRIGHIGELATETEALLINNGVKWSTFSDKVISCLPETPWKIPDEERSIRADFTKTRIFSIDPATAKDLDDALSVEPLPNGNYRVGVHIADVSHFVAPGTALDEEARKRATTVYLVEKAIPMLPRLLCEELCSLNPGVERLAFSVVWEMNKSGKILGTPWFGKSIIKSCAKLSYDHAQQVIENYKAETDPAFKPKVKNWLDILPEVKIEDYTPKDIEKDIITLYEMSVKMRKARYDNGALTMHSVKLWFGLDEQGNPVSTGVYPIRDSNRLVEEFMLLANMSVAGKLSTCFPETALLRNHEPPNSRTMDKFVETAQKLGYDMNIASSASLERSFNSVESKEHRIVLMQLCIRSMNRAKYFCTGSLEEPQWAHYALCTELYTHFTSPIRRYCDLIVHRELHSCLTQERKGDVEARKKVQHVAEVVPASKGDDDNKDKKRKKRKTKINSEGYMDVYDTETVKEIAEQCNTRKWASKEAQDGSQQLYLCVYLNSVGKNEGTVAEALIYNLGKRSVDVFIPKFGIETRIWIDEGIEDGTVAGCKLYKSSAGKPYMKVHWIKRGGSTSQGVAVLDEDESAENANSRNVVAKVGDVSSMKTGKKSTGPDENLEIEIADHREGRSNMSAGQQRRLLDIEKELHDSLYSEEKDEDDEKNAVVEEWADNEAKLLKTKEAKTAAKSTKEEPIEDDGDENYTDIDSNEDFGDDDDELDEFTRANGALISNPKSKKSKNNLTKVSLKGNQLKQSLGNLPPGPNSHKHRKRPQKKKEPEIIDPTGSVTVIQTLRLLSRIYVRITADMTKSPAQLKVKGEMPDISWYLEQNPDIPVDK